MTATQNPHSDEFNVVSLADEHAEEAVTSLGQAKDTLETQALVAALCAMADATQALVAALCACAMADAILALGARVDALRETLNRELPDIGGAIVDAGTTIADAGQD